MSEPDQTKSNITICPSCNGWGFLAAPEHAIHTAGERQKGTDVEIICKECGGKGVWLEEGGARYFWSQSPGMAPDAGRALKSGGRALLKIAVILFVILAYWEAIDFSLIRPDGPFALFQERGMTPLLFWLATAIVMRSFHKLRSKSEPEGLAKFNKENISRLKGKDARAEDFNIEQFLAPEAKEKIQRAISLAKKNKSPVLVWYLLKALLADQKISFAFIRLEENSSNLSGLLDEKIKELAETKEAGTDSTAESKQAGKERLSPDAKKALFVAFSFARAAGEKNISSMDLLIALALSSKEIGFFLEEAEINVEDLSSAIWWAQRKKNTDFWGKLLPWTKKRRVFIKHRIMNRAWTARPTPALDRFSYDITDLALAGAIAPIVDREREMTDIIRILGRDSKNNVLLVGESGSGRKTIVNALGRLMIRDDVLPKLKDKRLVSLNASLVISGVRAGGELEERIHGILSEIQMAGNIILFISDIHNLAESGSEHGFDVSEILTPIFNKSDFQVIGTTTFSDYHKTIEKRGDFADTFDVVKIDEVAPEVALEILEREAPEIEEKEEVVFTFSAIKKSIELSRRYIFNKLLPTKAIDLLSEAAIMVRTAKGKNAVVRSADIMSLVTEKTGVPVTDVTRMEADKLVNLEEEIHKRMVDQNEAVKVVSEAIKRMRIGLKNEKKPMGVFLFLGPTGVGKTELAKTLAEVYFGSEESMVRLDMSEFQETTSIDRLIGSGDGEINGVLTEGVKKNPFSLVLLDEFEKSHPNVLDLFLQVFDDGRLTDGLGRTVDFTNTIIIATSNSGSKIIQERLKEGKTIDEFRPEIEDYLLKYFKPELLNRFNAQVVFKTLSREDISQIAAIQVRKLAKRLEDAQGIRLVVAPKAMDKIVALGYSPFYGARNLQRTITEKLENIIADKFLRGAIKRGEVFTVEDIE